MMHGIPKRWRAMAWTAPTLGLLLCAGPALAREPNVGEVVGGPASQQSLGEPASTSPSNVVSTVPTTAVDFINPNASVRQITLNPDKIGQVNGPVVKRSGMILYVRDATGPVVPLDMSALRILKQPEKGQHVQALYQVNQMANVVLSLQGERQD